MKQIKFYYWLSALSGCIWAVIAYVLSFGAIGLLFLGGVIASPLIGLFIGFLYRPAYKLSKGWQVFISLFTLYFAASLFGLAMGIYGVYGRNIPNLLSEEIIRQSVLLTLWGLTSMGYVLLLWPLSFLNHRLLARTQKAV